LFISKYVAGYARTYPDPCRDLRRHLRLYLYLDLNLNLDLAPHPAPNRALFEKSYATLFDRLRGLKGRWLHGSVYLGCTYRYATGGTGGPEAEIKDSDLVVGTFPEARNVCCRMQMERRKSVPPKARPTAHCQPALSRPARSCGRKASTR